MPEAASSVKQWKFFKYLAAHGDAAKSHGMSSTKAKEMISGQPSPKGLPERAGKKK